MGPNNDPPALAQQNARDVGYAFAKKYYEGAVRGPEGVMELFGDKSVYVGTNGNEAHGLEDIRNSIGDLNLQEGKIVVVSVNSAFTDNGGVMVQTVANYYYESAKYGFSEAFHLVPQTKGWYVRSCLFKWHDKTPEHGENKEDKSSDKESVNVLANGHAEAKKPASEIKKPAAEIKKPASEIKKPASESKKSAAEAKRIASESKKTETVSEASEKAEKPAERKIVEPKVTESKDSGLTNGTSTPPSTPTKPVATSQPASKPAPAVNAAPTSWAACVKSTVNPVANNANSVKPTPSTTVTNSAALDPIAKSPTSNKTTNVNGDAPVESAQDRQNRNRKPTKAKSDFTVHVSKIIKGQHATEKDVIVDLQKAFQEFGPIAHVRVPGRRLADENETTLYAFVDFQEKKDFEKIFADRERDDEGRVKVVIKLPVLSFDGEVLVAQNHDRGRMFHRHRRPSDNGRPNGNNGRPFNNRRPPRPNGPSSGNNGPSGNRPPQTGNRNHSNNRRKENGNVKPKV